MSVNQERVLAHTLGRELSIDEVRAVAGAGTSTTVQEEMCDNDDEEFVDCVEEN